MQVLDLAERLYRVSAVLFARCVSARASPVVATPVGGIRETVVGQTAMAARAVDLARELGVLDRGVLFNFGWTPYEERHSCSRPMGSHRATQRRARRAAA